MGSSKVGRKENRSSGKDEVGVNVGEDSEDVEMISKVDEAMRVMKSSEAEMDAKRNQLQVKLKACLQVVQNQCRFRKPDIKNMNLLIREFGDARYLSLVFDAFGEILKEKKLQPSIHTLTNMINACVRCGELGRARELFMKIEKSYDLVPNEVTFTAMLKGECLMASNMIAAMKLFSTMKEGIDISPNIRTYNTLIRGCMRHGDTHSARILMNELEQRSFTSLKRKRSEDTIAPDSASFEYYIKTLCIRGKIRRARHALKRMISKHGIKPTPPVYSSLALVYALLNQDRHARRAIRRARRSASGTSHPQPKEFSSVAEYSKKKSLALFNRLRDSDVLTQCDSIEQFLSTYPDRDSTVRTKICETMRNGWFRDHLVMLSEGASRKNTPAKVPSEFWSSRIDVKMEVCSGYGDWVVKRAEEERESAHWIGLEVRVDRVFSTWSKAQMLQVSNLLLLCGLAEEMMKKCIPDSSLSEIYVNYPDPPPPDLLCSSSTLVNDAFLIESARVLRPNGILVLVTDNSGYAARMQNVLLNHRSRFHSAIESESFQTEHPHYFTCALPSDYGFSYFDAMWKNGNVNRRFFAKLVKS